jgi:hypothetical protein
LNEIKNEEDKEDEEKSEFADQQLIDDTVDELLKDISMSKPIFEKIIKFIKKFYRSLNI